MAALGRIALVTDFGVGSPYLGQIRLLMAASCPGLPVVELISDLPSFRPDLAAYLLPPLVRDLPPGTLYLVVVDPGVGSDRRALVVEGDGNLYVGPDNGLFSQVVRRARQPRVYRIDWRPERLSPSFQGRDLFTPVALDLATDRGQIPLAPISVDGLVGGDWPDELPAIIYQDVYGNAMTGLRASGLMPTQDLSVQGHRLSFARTFHLMPVGKAFWYENAFGLVEIAVNQGSARQELGLQLGDPVALFIP